MNDPSVASDAVGADLPFRSIAALIREHAQAVPRHPALVDSASTLDYGSLDALMDRVAASLQRDGVAAGRFDRDLRRQLDALRGDLPGRAARRRRRRAARRIGHAGELSLDARRRRRAPALRRRQRRRGPRRRDDAGLPRRISLDGKASGTAFDAWLAAAGSAPHAVEIRPEMAFNIIYSSGTTGTPKGIVQPHGMRWTHVMRGGRFGYSRETVTLLATPLYSNTTLVVFFPTIAFGGTVVLMEKFDVDRYLALAEHHRVTHTMLVPVQYQRLMASPRFGAHDLSSFRMKFCTSAPFAAALKADVVARWPGGLVEFYGMTEGGGTCILAAHEHPDKLHTVGQPAEGHDIRLIDEAGRELPRGATGEVVGHSAGMMAGYHGQPAKTAEAEWFDATGKRFIRTGDVGRFDDDGFLTLVDRRKDMIISGGFNLYPSDLEAVLREHPDVAEAAVAGVPSERWGETPAAWIVAREGARIDAEAVRAWANERLGKTQRIAFLEVVDELPRSAIGKVLKRELRDRFVATRPPSSGASHG